MSSNIQDFPLKLLHSSFDLSLSLHFLMCSIFLLTPFPCSVKPHHSFFSPFPSFSPPTQHFLLPTPFLLFPNPLFFVPSRLSIPSSPYSSSTSFSLSLLRLLLLSLTPHPLPFPSTRLTHLFFSPHHQLWVHLLSPHAHVSPCLPFPSPFFTPSHPHIPSSSLAFTVFPLHLNLLLPSPALLPRPPCR